MNVKIPGVSSDYWDLLRDFQRLKAKMMSAEEYLRLCSFSSSLNDQNYMNKLMIQKALEQLHGVNEK